MLSRIPRPLGVAVATLILMCSLGTLAWAINDSTPPPCSDVPSWASLGDCNPSPSPAPTQSTTPRPSTSSQPSARPSGTASSSASARPQPTSTGRPSTNAEEWATEAGKGVPTLTEAVQQSYSQQTGMSRNYWQIYAIMFGFGMVIFAVMVVTSLAKASRGGVRERAEFLDSLPKFFFWTPVMSVIPATVAWVYVQLAEPIGQGIGGETNRAMKEVIAATNRFFFQDPMGLLNAVGGAIVGFFLFMGTVVVMFVWLIEHEVAKFGVYLLTVLIPVSAALSLNRKWAKMGARTVAAVIGCMAVPVMTKLAFWVAWAAMGDKLRTGDNFMMNMLTILVIFSLATSAPIMLSYLAPNLLPYGGTAYGNSGGSARGHSQQAMNHAGNALSRLTNGMKGKGMSPGGGAAAEGTAARAAAGAAAEAGGAAAAGGAVLGPLAAAAMAVGAAHEAVESASRSAAGEQLGAASGGHTSHAGGSSMPMPSHRGGGGGGSRPASTDSASGDGAAPDAPVGTGDGLPASSWSHSDAGTAGGPAGRGYDGGPAGGGYDGGGAPAVSDLVAGTSSGSMFAGPDAPITGGMDMPTSGDGAGDGAASPDSFFARPVVAPDGPLPSGAPDFIAATPGSGASLFAPAAPTMGADDSSAPLTAAQMGLVSAPQFIPAPAQRPTRPPRDSGTAPPPPPPPTAAPQQPRRSAARWPFGRRAR